MILRRSDIDDFIEAYSDYQLEARKEHSVDAQERFITWLNDNPQVMMPSGMQEYLSAQSIPRFRNQAITVGLTDFPRPAFRLFRGIWLLPTTIASSSDSEWTAYEFNESSDDQLDEDNMPPRMSLPTASEIIKNAEKFLDSPYNDPTTFTCSRIWTPKAQELQRVSLQSSAALLIGEIKAQKKSLADISWRSLEEIVTEVLRSRGLEVHHVTEAPQGGRDIIVRGCLADGLDPITMAVEIKHRDLVDRPEIQQSVAQNAHYPALMLVTSGRFTAGVFEEAQKPHNQLRLFLKDGVAIGDMIRAYK